MTLKRTDILHGILLAKIRASTEQDDAARAGADDLLGMWTLIEDALSFLEEHPEQMGELAERYSHDDVGGPFLAFVSSAVQVTKPPEA